MEALTIPEARQLAELSRIGRDVGMDMSLNGTLVVAGYEAALANRALFYAGLIPADRP